MYKRQTKHLGMSSMHLEHYAEKTARTIPNVVGFTPNVIAVSYTHLRAHETVLDLVCRLLLEKKKHHHNKTLQ